MLADTRPVGLCAVLHERDPILRAEPLERRDVGRLPV